MARRSKRDKRKRYELLLRYLRKTFESMEWVYVASVRYTIDELVARVQLLLDDIKRSDEARVAWQAALAIERRREREARKFLKCLDELVAGVYGGGHPQIAAMGVKRGKTGPKTLEGKVRGAKKAAATRAQRGTPRRRRR